VRKGKGIYNAGEKIDERGDSEGDGIEVTDLCRRVYELGESHATTFGVG
jgi:hypothetical protein